MSIFGINNDPVKMILPCLFISGTQQMGRGVFTTERIMAGTVVEISPVIVMTAAERKLLDQTLLHDYIFEWENEHEKCCMALGYVAMYNHSYNSNCEYEMDFERQIIKIKAIHDVKSGQELFINYNGNWDDARPVWFDAK